MQVSGWKKLSWESRFFLFALFLALFVFLYHLGLMPLLDDEPTRALVSLEMVLSGNYIVPTTHGELYQNKPPLFNWFLASLMRMDPHLNEFWLRVPSMLAFLFTAASIYLFLKKELSAKTALVSSLAYLTCGRILFYDSMLGYIDPFFTWVLLGEVMVLYQLVKGKSPWWIFPLSYLLCLLGYLFKGLPALVFHGCTLLVAIYLSKKPRLLLSFSHLGGVFVFLLGVGAYYLAYSRQENVSSLFATLWQQSSSRTAAQFSWKENIEYVLTFPFQFVMHFLPWTLLSLVLFHKKAFHHIKGNTCLYYCSLVFLANIWVYWISPETRPRYLFVFLPLFFAVTIDSFYSILNPSTVKKVYWVILGLSLLCAVAVLVPLLVPVLRQMRLSVTVCLLCAVVIMFLADLMYKRPVFYLPLFAIVLLTVRLVFNHFILPARKLEAPESEYKKVGTQIGRLTKQYPVHLLENTLIDHDLAYYISSTNGKILSHTYEEIREGEHYICSEEVLKRHDLVPELRFRTNFENATLFLAKKK